MNKPVNHHYVPQHFLRAWAKPGSNDRLFRFKFTPTNKFECKEVSIKNSASQDNLYEVQLPDGSFEIESLVVTPELDELGHKILAKARNETLHQLTDKEKKELAIYLVCLEARHPETLAKMNIQDQVARLGEKIKNERNVNAEHVNGIINYLKNSSLGVISFGSVVKNERNGLIAPPFSGCLVRSQTIEYLFDSDCLITSELPFFRTGEYYGDFQYAIAISPRKAIIYSSNPDVGVYEALPPPLRPHLVNLFSLANAERAFAHSQDFASFIELHLGWGRACQTTKLRQAYMKDFLIKTAAQYGIVMT